MERSWILPIQQTRVGCRSLERIFEPKELSFNARSGEVPVIKCQKTHTTTKGGKYLLSLIWANDENLSRNYLQKRKRGRGRRCAAAPHTNVAIANYTLPLQSNRHDSEFRVDNNIQRKCAHLSFINNFFFGNVEGVLMRPKCW